MWEVAVTFILTNETCLFNKEGKCIYISKKCTEGNCPFKEDS